jgi:ubiquinone/menaquinone biosynthesis C-methylase UbiE
VGAGAGSYEPPDREVTAVEPSEVMIAQRPPGSPPAVCAEAEQLPFADDSFDAVMAILTIHHWQDLDAGLAEMARVARQRVVIVTYDPEVNARVWIVQDYLPEILDEIGGWLPSLARIRKALPTADIRSLPVPRDCSDRMFATLWARPEEYLDPAVRQATSVWHALPNAVAERALAQLTADLASGAWDARHGHLRTEP